MKFDNLKQDKGVAGLTILLSLVTTLFVIGLLVFIFAIMGGQFKEVDSIKASESATTTQSNLLFVDSGTTLTACNNANQGTITTIVSVVNNTVTLTSNNYTYSGCVLYADGSSAWNGTTISNVTYTYFYAGTSWDIVNETSDSIASVTDWYDIFIVIGAMVVLILLTVMIITAIRESALMVGSSKVGVGNVGSA